MISSIVAVLSLFVLTVIISDFQFISTAYAQGAGSAVEDGSMMEGFAGGAYGVGAFLIKYILSPLIAFLIFVVGLLVDLFAFLCGKTMEYTNLADISVINDTWKVVRDGVNIVFIAVLLVAGVFNIIHYEPETYALSEYMPKFVIAVIGVNFSKLMCFFILDFVNVLTATIYTYIGGSELGMYGQNIVMFSMLLGIQVHLGEPM